MSKDIYRATYAYSQEAGNLYRLSVNSNPHNISGLNAWEGFGDFVCVFNSELRNNSKPVDFFSEGFSSSEKEVLEDLVYTHNARLK